jgi:hypothetical protein
MGLLKLISNRISTEWKEKFNKNVDYVNSLEKKLSDQNKSTNSRIDNLVLHSGGDSPNEVVDARVNCKGETFDTLQERIANHEKEANSNVDDVSKKYEDLKAQVEQINTSIQEIIAGSVPAIDLYVSADQGNDETGNGSEERPYATIQTAINQLALISIPTITIWIDDGIYLEDVVIKNINFTTLWIKPINSVTTIDPSASDLPVKVRSIGFYQCKGYYRVTGIQFVDQKNGLLFGGSTYGLLVEQGGYLAVDKCKFADDTRNTSATGVYCGGLSAMNLYTNTYFYRQNIAIHGKLMSQINIYDVKGSENTKGIRCLASIARGTLPSNFATTPTEALENGLIITKGTVLS